MAQGKRWTTLNNTLCANVWSIDTWDELLDFARTQNESYVPPLPDPE